MTKTQAVLNHLKANKTITSWEAIEKYRATRLSSIIFNLRFKYKIDTDMITPLTKGGARFARYVYKGAIK